MTSRLLCLGRGRLGLSTAGDKVGSELGERGSELLLPIVNKLPLTLCSLGSKKEGLGGVWVDIVVVEIFIVCPIRDTVNHFTLHS
jgi:hypothetical protein